MLQGKTLEKDLPKKVPEQLKELLIRCWSMNAENRPTFEEIHQNLMLLKPREGVFL